MRILMNALLLVMAVTSFSEHAQAQGFGPARPDRPVWDRRPHNRPDRRPDWDRRPDRRPDRDRRDDRCWEEAERIANSVVNLSNTIYWKLDREVYRMDNQLRRSLRELSSSAENFRYAARVYRNVNGSISDLLSLERNLRDVISDLRYVREAQCVSIELRDLQDYVSELLYIFRQN